MLTDDPVLSQLLLGTALSLVTGAMCALMARRANRHPIRWFVVGFFFGLIAVVFLFFLSRYRPVKAEEPVAGMAAPSPWENNHWYFLDGERKRRGPFNFQELSSAARQGELEEESWVWNDQLEGWRRVHQLDGLPTDLNLK